MKLCIFDVDGTLIYLEKDKIISLFNSIKKETSSKATIEERACMDFWFGLNETELPRSLNLSEEEFWSHFRRRDSPEFRRLNSRPYADVKIIDSLRLNGIKIAFNSDAPESIVLAQIADLKKEDDILVVNHGGIKRKPSPQGINEIIKMSDVLREDCFYVGNTAKDVSAAISAGVVSLLVERENQPEVEFPNPDYRISSLYELDNLLGKAEKVLFRELNIANSPNLEKLSMLERGRLQNHFRRMQQHSLVAGRFMAYQAMELGMNEDLWRDTGILHDLDYSRVYFDMRNHGLIGAQIIKNCGFSRDIAETVEKHNSLNYKFSKDPYKLSMFFSGRFIKQMVHAARKFRGGDVSKLDLEEFDSVYSQDVRRNEKLTRLDPEPEQFSEFKMWMQHHIESIGAYPLSKEQLFYMAKKAFCDQRTRVSIHTNDYEAQFVKK